MLQKQSQRLFDGFFLQAHQTLRNAFPTSLAGSAKIMAAIYPNCDFDFENCRCTKPSGTAGQIVWWLWVFKLKVTVRADCCLNLCWAGEWGWECIPACWCNFVFRQVTMGDNKLSNSFCHCHSLVVLPHTPECWHQPCGNHLEQCGCCRGNSPTGGFSASV